MRCCVVMEIDRQEATSSGVTEKSPEELLTERQRARRGKPPEATHPRRWLRRGNALLGGNSGHPPEGSHRQRWRHPDCVDPELL